MIDLHRLLWSVLQILGPLENRKPAALQISPGMLLLPWCIPGLQSFLVDRQFYGLGLDDAASASVDHHVVGSTWCCNAIARCTTACEPGACSQENNDRDPGCGALHSISVVVTKEQQTAEDNPKSASPSPRCGLRLLHRVGDHKGHACGSRCAAA